MVCPKCKGVGYYTKETEVPGYRDHRDWSYDETPCPKCKGKGYLSPEEAGLDKF